MKTAMKQSKLIVIFNTVILSLLIVCVVALVLNNLYSLKRAQANRDRFNLYLNASRFTQASSQLTDDVRAYAATGSITFKNEYFDELNNQKNRELGIETMRKIGLTSEEEKMVSAMMEISEQLVPIEKEAIKNTDIGKTKEAIALIYGNEYIKELNKIGEIKAKFYEQLDARTLARVDQLNVGWIISSIVVEILLAAILVIQIVQSRIVKIKVVRPIMEIEKEMQKISRGKLGSEFMLKPDTSEIGMLIAAILNTKRELKKYIADISNQLAQMADKNMDVRQKINYIGDFAPIQQSLSTIFTSMNTTLDSINTAAEMVSGHAHQVAFGAQALAQGSTEQAATVQELSATVQELSGRMSEIAKNAEQAKNVNDGATEHLLLSDQKMQDMRSAMDAISKSSQQIGNIIKTIEDIAFQTNILALNAAVEAARAGAAGKGFAVVADEVRNLANKSQEASQRTTALIEDSTRAVAQGVSLANETAQALESVVEKSRACSIYVDQIADDSKEQAASLIQISEGIGDIANVVHTNSATSEESAAAAQELNSQAAELRHLVGEFKLRAKKEEETVSV